MAKLLDLLQASADLGSLTSDEMRELAGEIRDKGFQGFEYYTEVLFGNHRLIRDFPSPVEVRLLLIDIQRGHFIDLGLFVIEFSESK